MRPKSFTTPLVAVLALAACLLAAGASAQRGGSRQANDNASRGAAQTKRVFVRGGSETKQGSRVTITADDTLKDYSAYRSGDRFYVVLPKSAAGAAGRGGAGKGYTDMQVEQRGDSVVLSYRVQPGAKPRVEQKFNRLDVVFDVPQGGQQAPAAGNAGIVNPPAAAGNNPNTAAPQAGQTQPAATSTEEAAANERRNAAQQQAEAARAQAANVTQPGAATAGAPVIPTPAGAEQGAVAGVPPLTVPTQEGAPAATPLAEPQLAQAQPPPVIAPITTSSPATNVAQPATLGAYLLANWWIVVIALAVVGLGLVFAARRTPSTAPAVEEGSKAPAALASEEAHASRRVEPSAVASKPSAVASKEAAAVAPKGASTGADAPKLDAVGEPSLDAKPLAAASALASSVAAGKARKKSKKELRQEAKRKKKGTRTQEFETDEDATIVASAAAPVAETAVGTVADSTAEAAEPSVEHAVEEARVTQPSAEEPSVAAEEAAVPGEVSDVDLRAADAVAVVEPTADEAADVVAPTAVGLAGTQAVEPAEPSHFTSAESLPAETAGAATETLPVESKTSEIEPFGETGTVDAVPFAAVAEAPTVAASGETAPAEAEAAAPVTEIAPAFAPDAESVQAETRRLLEGGEYDRAVVGSRDPMARQMIGAELLYALNSRNAPRRERARAAFYEHGYYDETAHDLRGADAPAERSAAARSLALLGDRTSTPHLVAALEDSSMDVRRAAVEALGTLRDPAAVAPLEALLEREKSERNRIPGRVIRIAIESCREGSAEAPAGTQAPAPVVETREVTPAPSPEAAAAPEPEVLTSSQSEVLTEPAFESAGAAESVTAIEPAPAADVEHAEAVSTTAASFDVAPEAEAYAPQAEAPPAAEAFTAAPEEERTVALMPFVEEQGIEAAAETAPAADASVEVAHAPAEVAPEEAYEGEEETLVAEAEPSTAFESPANAGAAAFVADARPFAEDLRAESPAAVEELPAVAETQTFESAVAEPQAVMEMGLQPYAEPEAAAAEVSEDAAAGVVEEVGVEPFVEYSAADDALHAPESGTQFVDSAAPSADFYVDSEVPSADVDSEVPSAEPASAPLFTDEPAEVTREVEPFKADEDVTFTAGSEPAAGAGEVATGEWFDLDISELQARDRHAAAESHAAEPERFAAMPESSAAEPSSHAPLFESSSGEVFAAPATAEGTAAADEPAFTATFEEPTHTAAPRAETGRDFEVAGVGEPLAAQASSAPPAREAQPAPAAEVQEKGLAPIDEYSTVPASIQHRLNSREPSERAAAVVELSHVDTDEAFQQICAAFDDESKEVRGAAARALFELRADRAESFTRALREATPERRRQIGAAIATSGLASESISQLTGESREKTYEAFSLLFLMAKAGEVAPLVRAIEGHPNNEVRLAVVKLLALSGQRDILPAFRRLAVRGSLPTEVRSAVMEAIYQISSSQPTHA